MFKWQFSFSSFNRDINTNRPDGSPNPHFGEIYTDQTYRRDDIGQYQRNGRLLLSYPIKWRFMEQRIVGMYGVRNEARNQTRLQLVRSNGTQRTDGAVPRVQDDRIAINRCWQFNQTGGFAAYACDKRSDSSPLTAGTDG